MRFLTGIDVANVFTATDKRKEKVMRYIRNEAGRRREKVDAETFGGLIRLCRDAEMDLEVDAPHDVVVLPGFVVDRANKEVALVLSTPHLLRNLLKLPTQTLMFDATYRILYQSYPILIYATMDLQNKMHIVAVGLVNTESSRHMKATLSAVLDAATAAGGNNVRTILTSSMTDNCAAGYQAIEEHMQVESPGVCYFHLKKAIRNRKFKVQSNRALFLFDVDKVASATIHGIHDEMLSRLKEKWKDAEPEVVEWIFRYWLHDNKRFWFTDPFSVRSNSGIEGVNRAFKEDCTQRAVLPINRFLPYLSEYLITKSRMDCELHECVKLDKEDWNKAQALQMGKLRGARAHCVK